MSSLPPKSAQRDARLPARTRRILHLDVDAFLASVEIALHPHLQGKPVVVGGPPSGRNLVMSCSYAARRFGVRPGMALSEAARRCPEAVFRDGDSQAANRLREEVTRILLDFTPQVEVASIDDFFCDLTGTYRLNGSAFGAAESMRTRVQEEVGLPISIGIATNRTLARIAGKLAKPGGIAEIFPGSEEALLSPLPVEHLPGVGHAIGLHLERFAIRTVGELRLVPREVLFASFGHNGLLLFDRSRGLDEDPVEATHREDEQGRLVVRPPRSIHRETTFEPEEGRPALIEAMLAYLVERASHRLRSHGAVAGSIEVRIRYVDTRSPSQRAHAQASSPAAARRRSFPYPTDSTDEIWAVARSILHDLPRRRALVKRVGLTLQRLGQRGGWQGQLFSDPEADRSFDDPQGGAQGSRAERHRKLDAALDQLRARLGFGRILRGSSTPLQKTHPLGEDGYRLRTPSLNQ